MMCKKQGQNTKEIRVLQNAYKILCGAFIYMKLYYLQKPFTVVYSFLLTSFHNTDSIIKNALYSSLTIKISG